MFLGLLLRAGPFLVLAGVLSAQEPDLRDKLMGSWREASATAASGATWVLEDRAGNIHITQSQAGQKVAEFECNTMGRECEIKDSGKHGKVSMWFNGSDLVAMETRGSDVTKRRFKVVQTGDAMELEVIPIVPAGKTELIKFQRLPGPVAPR